MLVKCGRNEIELNSSDVVMFNGVCYQIITKTVGCGWNRSLPVLAKTKATKMIKDGTLVFEKQEKSNMTKSSLTYYMVKEA